MPTSPSRPPSRPLSHSPVHAPSREPSRALHALEDPATQFVLREAKRLHRAATSGARIEALPVLRRVLAAGVVPAARTLPELFRTRGSVQRKHVLRTLAFEAGHATWEQYRQVLPQLDVQALRQRAEAERGTGRLKPWFASDAEARRFASAHGGRAVPVGRQTVVLADGHVGHTAAMDGVGNEASNEAGEVAA